MSEKQAHTIFGNMKEPNVFISEALAQLQNAEEAFLVRGLADRAEAIAQIHRGLLVLSRVPEALVINPALCRVCGAVQTGELDD